MGRLTSYIRWMIGRWTGVALLCFTALIGHAQADSLWRAYNTISYPDSVRAKALHTLAWKLVFEQPDSGMSLGNELLRFATSRSLPAARYDAHTTLAVANSMKSQLPEALGHLQQSLRTARQLKDRQRESNTLSNMSNVFKNLGDLPQALEHLQRSLRIDQELNNASGLAGTHSNIGNIHMELADPQKALMHYRTSDSIYTSLNDTKGRAATLMNMGVAHEQIGEMRLAQDELAQSMTLYRSMGRKLELGMVLNNLGRIHGTLGEIDKALNELTEAETLLAEIGNQRSLVRTYYFRGRILLQAGRIPEAIDACTKGLSLAKENGLLQQQKECNECLVGSYEARGDHRNAFFHQKAFLAASDSMAGLNNAREVTRLELTRSFQEQQIADSLRQVRADHERELHHAAELADEKQRRDLFLYGSLISIIVALALWSRLRYTRRSRSIIQKERDRSDDLLHNILPKDIARELKESGSARAREHHQVTVLFTDFKGFTEMAATMTPDELVQELNECFKAFDAIAETHGLEKIKTIGDAYMAAAGLNGDTVQAAHQCVLAAIEMQEFMEAHRSSKAMIGGTTFTMRAGIHTGPVIAGVVGSRKFAYDIWGDTVNVAARMESTGQAGRVNISATTYAIVSSCTELQFSPRGFIAVKGKGSLQMFFVERIGSRHDDLAHSASPTGKGDEQTVDTGRY